MLRGLRYKLRMMSVAVDGATHIYGDNMSTMKNTSKPESTLNKKIILFVITWLESQSPWGKPLWHIYLVQETQQA